MNQLKIQPPVPYIRTNYVPGTNNTIKQPLKYDIRNDKGTLVTIANGEDIYERLRTWFQVPRVSVGLTTYPPNRETLFLGLTNVSEGERIYTFELHYYPFAYDSSSGPTLIFNGPGFLVGQHYCSVQ